MAGLGDWPQVQPRRVGKGRRYAVQVVVAFTIFLLLLGLKEMGGDWGARVQKDLRSILTTEWNYQPVLERVVRHGLEAVDVDLPYLEEPSKPIAAPVENQFCLPVSGRVVRGFGWSKDPLDGLERYHTGIDIESSAGTPVKAVTGGEVVKIATDPVLGSYVMLDHGKDIATLYAQLQEVDVALGQRVAGGRVIGLAGTKGDITGSGLHFEYREGGRPVDPLDRVSVFKTGDGR
ncbi:MAG: M23 family metallopeptidase [Bacillota bacterium]